MTAVELAGGLCRVGVDLTFELAVRTVEEEDEEEPMVSVEDEGKTGGKKGAKGGNKKGAKKRTGGGGGLNAIGPDGKPNKGIVLKKSVDYIRCVTLLSLSLFAHFYSG